MKISHRTNIPLTDGDVFYLAPSLNGSHGEGIYFAGRGFDNLYYGDMEIVIDFEEAAERGVKFGVRYRVLGVILALFAFFTFLVKRVKKDAAGWKWYALARFLLGIGGEFVIPAEIAKDWESGIVDDKGDGRVFIRPSASTQLFWIVGGMTVQITDGVVEGVDVYDFHPQIGLQNTILGPQEELGWAWSGGPDDPTRIPAKIAGVSLMKLVKRLFPALTPRFIRERGKHLIFSNDLWNALGGKPFKSVLRTKM